MKRRGGKDIERLVDVALKQGWARTQTRNGHYLMTSPGGRTTVLPSTLTGSKRNLLNARAQLRRAGLEI